MEASDGELYTGRGDVTQEINLDDFDHVQCVHITFRQAKQNHSSCDLVSSHFSLREANIRLGATNSNQLPVYTLHVILYRLDSNLHPVRSS